MQGRCLHSLGLWVLTKQEGLLCRIQGSHRLFLCRLKQGDFPDVFFLQLYEGHKTPPQVLDSATHCTGRSPWPFSATLQGLSQHHSLLLPYRSNVSGTLKLALWYEVLLPETSQARLGIPSVHFVILGCQQPKTCSLFFCQLLYLAIAELSWTKGPEFWQPAWGLIFLS